MIDKLVQLLNLSNVKKIIYVDDIFCVERYLEDAHAVLRTWLETDDYHKLDFISSDKDVLEEEFDSWWNGATDDDNYDYLCSKYSSIERVVEAFPYEASQILQEYGYDKEGLIKDILNYHSWMSESRYR